MKHALIILVGNTEQINDEVHRLNAQHGGSFLLDICNWEHTSHKAICERVWTFGDSIQRMLLITHPCGIPSADLISLRHDIQSINRAVHFGYIELV